MPADPPGKTYRASSAPDMLLHPRQSPPLSIHGILMNSRANGPGNRAVIWTRGCTLGCPGCFNEETHDPAGGRPVTSTALLAELHQKVNLPPDALSKSPQKIDGLTISGGEPLQQSAALADFLKTVRRETDWSVILFSGFSREEIAKMAEAEALLSMVDVLFAGRYRREEHLGRDLRGSANKTVHFFSDRYRPADFHNLPAAEVRIGNDGEVILSGIQPLVLPKADRDW